MALAAEAAGKPRPLQNLRCDPQAGDVHGAVPSCPLTRAPSRVNGSQGHDPLVNPYHGLASARDPIENKGEQQACIMHALRRAASSVLCQCGGIGLIVQIVRPTVVVA